MTDHQSPRGATARIHAACTGPRADRLTVLAYTVLGLLACWAVGPFDVPVIADNQHYFFIAERFASGVPPHVSHFDPKNALSMMISGWAIMLGRALGVSDLYAARAASVTAAALSVGMIWEVARRYSGNRIAAHVAALSVFSFNQFFIMATVGARPKVFLVLFIILTLAAVVARREALSGLWAASAFLCWQPALMMAAAVPAAMLFWKRPLRAIVVFAIVFAAAVLAYESYFAVHGVLDEQIEQAYRFPSAHMSGLTFKANAILQRFRWLTKTYDDVSSKSVVPLVAIAFSLVSLVWALTRPRRVLAFVRERPEWLYFTLVSVGGLVFLHFDYQGFPDRFLIEPYLAIGFGVFATLPLTTRPRLAPLRRLAFAFVALAIAVCVHAVAHADWEEYRGPLLPRQYEVAERVGDMLDAGTSVYALGCTHLLAFNHANNWLKYGFFFRGVGDYTEARHGSPYVPYRNDELPDVILLSRGRSRGIASWLPRYYRRLNNDVLATNAIGVWAKRTIPLEVVPPGNYRDLRGRTRTSVPDAEPYPESTGH